MAGLCFHSLKTIPKY